MPHSHLEAAPPNELDNGMAGFASEPGLADWQQTHFVLSASFFTMHVLHSHLLPLLAEKVADRDVGNEGAGAAAAAGLDADGLAD